MTSVETNPQSTEVAKKKMAPEITLDDLQSYTLQLKDHDDPQKRSEHDRSLMGSTDGLMGSTDSFSVGAGSSADLSSAGLNSDDLHIRNHINSSTMRRSGGAPGSTDAMMSDESCGLHSNSSHTDWEYPDLDASQSGISQSGAMPRRSSRSSRPRIGGRRPLLGHQDSTRVMIGDDKSDPSYQSIRFLNPSDC